MSNISQVFTGSRGIGTDLPVNSSMVTGACFQWVSIPPGTECWATPLFNSRTVRIWFNDTMTLREVLRITADVCAWESILLFSTSNWETCCSARRIDSCIIRSTAPARTTWSFSASRSDFLDSTNWCDLSNSFYINSLLCCIWQKHDTVTEYVQFSPQFHDVFFLPQPQHLFRSIL